MKNVCQKDMMTRQNILTDYWRHIKMTEKTEESKSSPLDDILTEEEVQGLFGVSKNVLSRLRREQKLPFLRVTNVRRLFSASDVTEWLYGRKKTLNSDE